MEAIFKGFSKNVKKSTTISGKNKNSKKFWCTSYQTFVIMRAIGRYPYEKTCNDGACADCSHFYCGGRGTRQ